ncbi:hypothetical protein [Saccharicrinis aurantiacus]|uniref:hypothetical protein n=1 Tax=Saccharicrinis aurantiacus TaxID=1849719 RepID=UPI002491408F|nr:hypothetical protein [Saccharicrinis aurantiacus]
MKNILLILVCVIGLTSCYDDSYLDPKLDETIAYFASDVDYTRTLVVGEGLNFKIGAAMAGVIENREDRELEYMIYQENVNFDGADDMRVLMPKTYYNSEDLSGSIMTVIPKGKFLGYFSVSMDSTSFLADPMALTGEYTLPVKLVSSSLDSIRADSVNVSVRYMAGIEGMYLYKSVIEKELNGSIVSDATVTEMYSSEEDKNAWSFVTSAPFSVTATSATSAFTSGLAFDLTVNGDAISIESIDGQPVVELEGTNTYDPKTRDFELNFKYQMLPVNGVVNDTIYHVSNELIFRNRLRDGVNETREYLHYLN